jgi:2-ketoarginine methyltransferase
MTVQTAELKTTGQDAIFQLAKGYYTTKALLATWRMGLLERAAAGQDLDLETLAAERNCDASLLKPLFDYLVVRGYFEIVTPGTYRLTPRGFDASPYYGYLSTMMGAYEPVFAHIEDLALGRLEYGKDVVRSHEEMTRGLTALEDRLMGTVIEVVASGPHGKVLDLGCGSAQMLAKICALGPNVQAVGVDLSAGSCSVARETVERERLEGRLMIVQGNATDFKSLPAEALQGLAVVTVMFLLHELLRQRGRAGVVALLADIASVIGRGGRLVIVEVSGSAKPVYREDLLFVPEYELLHEYTNQRLAPRADWEAMVDEAGMRVQSFAPVNMCQSFCMVATPR